MSGKADRHLVIFARRPQYGSGKRRLAAEVGELTAWRFQRLALAALLRRFTRDPRWRTWLAITPDRARIATRGVTVAPQGGGDLGRRLQGVNRRLPPGRMVVIGSDAPQILAQDIAEAFRALGPSDAVLGPATDGGYWLIGLSRAARRNPPFEQVRWSTPHAMEDTLRRMDGRRVTLLRELEDVDDAASLARLDLACLRS